MWESTSEKLSFRPGMVMHPCIAELPEAEDGKLQASLGQ